LLEVLAAVVGGLALGLGGVLGYRAVVTRARYPRGQGAFVRNLKADGAPSPAEFAARAKALGMRWLALLAEVRGDKQASGIWDSELPAYARDLQAAGVEVWLWGWPAPADQVEFVADMKRQLERTGARGVIVDAEGPYVGDSLSKREAAAALARGMATLGVPWGVTSFGGGPRFFGRKAFPWLEFSAAADFGMPQIYDPPSDERARAWLSSWEKETRFPRLVVVLDANNPPAVMLERWRSLGSPRDVCWWTLDYLEGNQAKEAVARTVGAVRGAIS